MYYRDEAARITKANMQVAAASERKLSRVRTAVLQVCAVVRLRLFICGGCGQVKAGTWHGHSSAAGVCCCKTAPFCCRVCVVSERELASVRTAVLQACADARLCLFIKQASLQVSMS